MSRAALTILLALAGGAPAVAGGIDPHLDPSVIPAGCSGCHQGHGVSRSPMLPASQIRVCLACHGSRAGFNDMVGRGVVSGTVRPPFLSAVLAQAFVHPVSGHAFSRHESPEVACSSCHSTHRSLPEPVAFPGHRKLSPRDPSRFEFELCESCHGSGTIGPRGLRDVGRLLDPNNRSYHPVEAPAMASSPSVDPALERGAINCTDCHGNSDRSGPRGPHGSNVRHILRFEYTTADGLAESASAYALCYRCHRRELVLGPSPFAEHGMHVVAERVSCATCHDPHGSVGNRALIRFGDTSQFGIDAVAPAASGRLAFESAAPGSGTCYLTCHGRNHDPESYGIGLGDSASQPVPWRTGRN